MGELGQQKGQSADVKALAQKLVSDHSKANDELKQIASSKGVDLPNDLNAKDKIVALDGARVNKESFEARIAAKRAGDTVRLTLFRNDDLRTLEIKLAAVVDAPYRIVQLPAASDEQKRIYQSWLNGRSN